MAGCSAAGRKGGASGERARELYSRLPRPPLAELECEVPQGIYYALTDALSSVIDDSLEDLEYLEAKLADTPESLQADWLRGIHLSANDVPAQTWIPAFAGKTDCGFSRT